MKTIKLIILSLFVVLFSSCERSLNTSDGTPDKSNLVSFKLGFGTTTKTSTDANFMTVFTPGDAVGVYVVKHAAGETKSLLAASNYVDNAKLVYDGTNWTLDSSTPIYYANDGSQLDFYAYYPYNGNVTDASAIGVAAIDQSTQEAYNTSDIMSASTPNIEKNTTVSLQFNHLMSLVQVSLSGGGTRFTNFSANLTKVVQANTLNLATSTLGLSSSSVDVNMFCFSGDVVDPQNTPIIYRALVPAQTVKNGNPLFSFVRNGNIYSENLTGDELLKGGSVEQYDRTLPAITFFTIKYDTSNYREYHPKERVGSISDGFGDYGGPIVTVQYAEGDQLTLTPKPAGGYHFAGWTTDTYAGNDHIAFTDNPYTFTVTGNIQRLVAVFNN